MSTRNIESTEPDYGNLADSILSYIDHTPTVDLGSAVIHQHKPAIEKILRDGLTTYSAQHRITAEELRKAFDANDYLVGRTFSIRELEEMTSVLNSHSTPSPELEEQVLLGQAAKEAGWRRMRDKCEYKAPNWTMWVMCDSGPEDYFDPDYLYRRFMVKGSPKDVLAPTGESAPEATDADRQEWEEFMGADGEWRPIGVDDSAFYDDGLYRRPKPASTPENQVQLPKAEDGAEMPTPETDAAICLAPRTEPPALMNLVPHGYVVPVEFARTLERQRDEALARCRHLQIIVTERTQQRDAEQELLKVFTEADPDKSDWCPCCKQGWGCAEREENQRQQLADKDAEICRLKSAPASPWRDAKSDPPKESDGDRNGCVEWLWLYEMFVPHLETKSWDKAWSDDDLPSHWRHTNLPPLPTPAVEQDETLTPEQALALILPMAKGYAAEHPVGNNAKMIESAEKVLARRKEGQSHE